MPGTGLKLAVLLLASVGAFSQAVPGGSPAFEVASVRPSKLDAAQYSNIPLESGYVYGSASPDNVRSATGGSLVVTHTALWRYIVFAYKLNATQQMALRFSIYSGVPKSGAPFWATGSFDSSPEFFDISARAPADTSLGQMRVMMQTLLRDRFQLALHSVEADAPVFALVLSRPGQTGPSLQPHPAADSCEVPAVVAEKAAPEQGAVRGSTSPSAVGDLPSTCSVVTRVASSAPGVHYGGRAVPLSLVASTLPTMTGLAAIPRPVIDQTGLSGLYDFTLNWFHDASGDAAISDNIANFRSALKAQLGFELKPSHAPISFFIIDHVERPSEN